MLMPPLSLTDNEHVYMDLAQKLYKYCPKEWKKEASKVSGEVLHGELTAVRPPLSPSQVTSRTQECCQGEGGNLVRVGLEGGCAKSHPWGCHIPGVVTPSATVCPSWGCILHTPCLELWGFFSSVFISLPLSFSRIFEVPFFHILKSIWGFFPKVPFHSFSAEGVQAQVLALSCWMMIWESSSEVLQNSWGCHTQPPAF